LARSLCSARGAQRGRTTPGQQVRTGVFALLALAAMFGIYVFLNNLALHKNAYILAIHFHNVGGLQEGSTVQLSGVNVGLVDHIELLPDQTVDVICSISRGVKVYRESTFLVTTTLTGAATLAITPPQDIASATPLQSGILPENEQPWGRLPASFNDLIAEVQPRIKELDKTLAVLNRDLPAMANRFNAVAGHTDTLVTDADANLRQLTAQMTGTITALNGAIVSTQSVLSTSGRNVEQLTSTMNATVQENRAKIDALTTNLASAAGNLSQTMQTLASVAKDPQLKGNLIQTTTNVREASERMKKIAEDIENITGDPGVQSNLKGAVYDLSSTIAKANDILGTYSSATAHGPAPAATPGAPPGAGPPPQQPPSGRPGGLLRGFSAASLVQLQVRETWATTHAGPQSDINFVLLPLGKTHVTFGANDLGYNTSYNALLNKRLTPALQVSGGVLYSNLGLQLQFQPTGPLGLDARLYDSRNPKLDLYGNVTLFKRLQLFYGQRNMFSSPNRFGPPTSTPVFGFQTNY